MPWNPISSRKRESLLFAFERSHAADAIPAQSNDNEQDRPRISTQEKFSSEIQRGAEIAEDYHRYYRDVILETFILATSALLMVFGLTMIAAIAPHRGTGQRFGIYGKVLTPDAASSFVYPLLGFTATLVIALMITIPEKLSEMPLTDSVPATYDPSNYGTQYHLLHLRTTLAAGTKLMALLSFLVSTLQWTYMASYHRESNLEVLGKSLLLTLFSLFTLFVASLIRNNTHLDEYRSVAISARRLLIDDYKVAVWNLSTSQYRSTNYALRHKTLVGLFSLIFAITLTFGIPVIVLVLTTAHDISLWYLAPILAAALLTTALIPVLWIFYIGLLSSPLTDIYPRAAPESDLEARTAGELNRLHLRPLRKLRFRNFPDPTVGLSSALTLIAWTLWVAVIWSVVGTNNVNLAVAVALSLVSLSIPLSLAVFVWRSMLSVSENCGFAKRVWAAPRSNTVASLQRELDSLRESHEALKYVWLHSRERQSAEANA